MVRAKRPTCVQCKMRRSLSYDPAGRRCQECVDPEYSRKRQIFGWDEDGNRTGVDDE